jgi:hypothetical protein
VTAAIAGIVLALVAAFGAWMRKGGKDAATAKADQSYIDKRKAADNADLGIGASDAERIARLRSFSEQ